MSDKTYAIRIYDQKHQKIGELMAATESQIMEYQVKGFRVENIETGILFGEKAHPAHDCIGVSDGFISEN